MPDLDLNGTDALANGSNGRSDSLKAEEANALREWDPKVLLRSLYEISYEPRVETKRNRFVTMEGHVETTYVPEDYQKEEKSENKETRISLDAFSPAPGMQTRFDIDSSRFQCTEGLFKPKKWGLETKGLHQLINEAILQSPIDSRRTLYRNIYLAGGASLMPGLAEKLEQELSTVVPNTIHTQVNISPWRYNAAYLGAQIVASASTFEDQCVSLQQLPKFLAQLQSSSF
uniref:Actin n=2 Tax=Caenorhabditis japonica TaxID=281687 RepID=A0A8R1DJH1_CAEJA